MGGYYYSKAVNSVKLTFLAQLHPNAMHNTSYTTCWSFSLLKGSFLLWNLSPKKPELQTSLLPLWRVLNSQAMFSWLHSVQEILSKWLLTSLLTSTVGYGFSWAILFWAKHALTHWLLELFAKNAFFDILVVFRLDLGQISFNLVKNLFCNTTACPSSH